MSLKNNLYNEDSIKSLSPLEFTRLRPGVYVGSTEYSTQLLIEIVSNAIDEFRAGHGDTINVTIQEDNTITVEDFGQGFLINAVREEDNKTVLEAAFSVLNTSGKYDEDNVYDGVALGLNGIGSKLCVYLSSTSNVLTHRDGKYEHIWFTEGVFDHRKVGDWNKKPDSGTIVTWKPSPEFFEYTEVNYPEVDKLFKVLVCLCPGLKINVDNKGKELNYYSKNGINDLIDSEVKKDEVLKNRLCINFSEGKNKLDLVATYTNGYNTIITPYVNTGLTQAGPHITSIKSAITREFNKFFREKGWLKEKDSNLTGDDLQEGLYLVFNITAPGVSYDAQTKSRIVKIDMTPFTKVINESIQKWLSSNEKDVKQIVDKALNARKAREAARKARDAARGLKAKKESGLKAKMQLSNKFIDCTSRDPKKRKLLLVEGQQLRP